MATVKDTAIEELTAELTAINTVITNVQTNGQSFQKGGRSGFAVQMAKLPDLLNQKQKIKDKLATWGVYDE